MQCNQCLYENNCKLKEISKYLTGCEGHSKERPPHKGEVKCLCCKQWKNKNKVFTHIDGNNHICFDCY